MYVNLVEEDYEDICQILRMKIWRALGTFDPSRSSMQVKNYVFGCMRNQCKDLVRKKKRNEAFMEDYRHAGATTDTGGRRKSSADAFDARYLSTGHEEAFRDVEEEALPLIPTTLSQVEREIALLLFYDFSPLEIGRRMGLRRGQVNGSIEAIQVKMSDWRPDPQESEAA
jgi:RNA polymerase sigma factor (sigma-70 family)